jgi:hypothetical protein
MTELKPFLFPAMDNSMLRIEWERWKRSFEIYCDSAEINDVVKKRTKFLHFGGLDIQELAYNIPGALEVYDEKAKNDVYKHLIEMLDAHFAPIRNSTFERHLFRNLKPKEN